MPRRFLLLSTVLLLICPNGIGQDEVRQSEPRDNPKTAPRLAAIDAAMQTFVETGTASGVVTLVAHEGKVVHLGSVGLADIDANKKMQPGSLFSIASMTKPIVATALMILVEDGKLDLDDKVSLYLPAFSELKLKTGESPDREITIGDAITHTSGLSGKQTFPGTLAEAIDELATRPLAFQPRTKWQYSPGLNVIGRIIEIVSNQPLDDFLQERIFSPLKMHDTTFRPDPTQLPRMATLYGPSDDKTSLVAVANRVGDFADVKGINPSGGLVSSARDMFHFYQMILDKGQFRNERIVSTATVKQMTSPQTGDLKTGFTPGNCWGLGWCIVRHPQDVTGMLSAGTFGHGGAFGTQGWVDPKTNTIYVLMIQREKMGNSDGSEIRKTFQQVAHDSLGL